MLPVSPESVCASAPRCFTVAALGCLAGTAEPPAGGEFSPPDPNAPGHPDYADLLEVAAATPYLPEAGTCPAGDTCYRIAGPVLGAAKLVPPAA